MPAVSIILPVYNGEHYLRESLDSILSQTFSDFECIIVNDCSTDSSLAIAEEYATKDSRFKVITNEKNSKLPFSLNVGHKAAKSDLLTWTSDDNIMFPNFLEVHMKYFDDKNIDITYGPYLKIDEYGLPLQKQWKQLPPYIPIKEVEFENQKYLVKDTLPPECMCNDNCIGASFMYRRRVFEELNGYDVNTFLYEDYDFWIRAYRAGMHYEQIYETVYKYRTHPNALSARIFPKDYYNFRYEIRKILPAHNKEIAFETRMTLHRDICPFLSKSKHLKILLEAFLIDPQKFIRLIVKKSKSKILK